jgi:LDH2 family malate/lactate/ureidoglycolate dehydrogenase
MSDIRVDRADLERFCAAVFVRLGMPGQEAADSAEILVAADARGIGSHGVARLQRYVTGIRNGLMLPESSPVYVRKTPMSFVLDAQGGIGLSVGKRAMREVIALAKDRGAAFASVRDSNHFGIAGYYAEMALTEDMIGIAMTNTAALGVPTFGRDAMFGTNPIAVAVPAGKEAPFVLDMATTVVTRGKIETREREGMPIPAGWAVGTDGSTCTDPAALLLDMFFQRGGGILPLGGEGETFGGHKGYGLGILVDILTAISSGGVFGKAVMDSEATMARVCHFFGAIRIDLFREPGEFKADMDRMLRALADAKPAEGEEQVLYAGLKESRSEEESWRIGVSLPEKVRENLGAIAAELGMEAPKAIRMESGEGKTDGS